MCCIAEIQCDLLDESDLINIKKEPGEELIPDPMQVDNDQLIQKEEEDSKTLMKGNTSTVILKTFVDDSPTSIISVKPEAVSTDMTATDLRNNQEQKGKILP